MSENKRLERNPMNKVIGGVCSGLADFLKIDVALLRMSFVIAFLFATFGFWLYAILWIAMPKKAKEETEQDDNYPDKVNLKPIFTGSFIILTGLLILANNFIPLTWVGKLWPIVLVLVGILLIFFASKKNNKKNDNE